MNKPKPPAAPDPATTIAAQTQANLATANQNAELNRVNQVTPYGNLTYSNSGNNPDGTANYSATVSLSPQEQQIFDNQTQGQINLGNTALGMQGQVANSYSNPLDTSHQPGINSTGGNTSGINGQGPSTSGISGQINTSGVPGLVSGVSGYGNVQNGIDLSGVPGMQSTINNSGPGITGHVTNGSNAPWAIQQAENAAYGQQAQYLNPQFSQKHEALDNSLINQGITQGSDAYNTAQQNLGLQENQAYGNAGMQAVQAGQNEQNTLFGQGLAGANLQNSANAQGFGQGLSAAQLANSVNQQGFSQALDAGNFANQAQQQGYSQAMGNANLQNSANAQAFGQSQSQLQAQNAAQQQGYDQQFQNAGLANQAQQQGYNQQFQNAGLQNQAQTQYMQQLFALRNQPLNEYNSLMTGAQVQSPTFTSTPTAQVANTDVGGITNNGFQNQMSAYQASQQGMNNLFSLGGSLGSAAILASDRRLKREIKRVSTTPGGIPIYAYRYNNDDSQIHYGVMADEILEIIPEAVSTDENGFYRVDYGKVL